MQYLRTWENLQKVVVKNCQLICALQNDNAMIVYFDVELTNEITPLHSLKIFETTRQQKEQ